MVAGSCLAMWVAMKHTVNIATDDAKKLIVSHTVLTCSKQYLHNTKREDLVENIGMVPAKYPPKVKLELFTTLEC